MGLKTEVLHEALVKLLEDIGYGGLSYVARQANLTAAGVKKIKERDGVPKLESWEKLHNAFPHQIPPPAFEGPATIVKADGGAKADGSHTAGSDDDTPKDSSLRKVVIFNPAEDEEVSWSDAGSPAGAGLKYDFLPENWLDDNAFMVQVADREMHPTLNVGDKVLVAPGQPVESGDLCFAAWPNNGKNMIKRFRRSGLTIILEADNPEREPVVLDSQRDRGVKIFRINKVMRDV